MIISEPIKYDTQAMLIFKCVQLSFSWYKSSTPTNIHRWKQTHSHIFVISHWYLCYLFDSCVPFCMHTCSLNPFLSLVIVEVSRNWLIYSKRKVFIIEYLISKSKRQWSLYTSCVRIMLSKMLWLIALHLFFLSYLFSS